MRVKGNTFRNKRVLTEHIHFLVAEKAREQRVKDELNARRKVKAKTTNATATSSN